MLSLGGLCGELGLVGCSLDAAQHGFHQRLRLPAGNDQRGERTLLLVLVHARPLR